MVVTFITAQELFEQQDWLILDASYYLDGGTLKAVDNYEGDAIPGAKFWNIDACVHPHSTLPHMLAPEIIFLHFLTSSGWQRGQSICVYDQQGLFSAPRLAWELIKREVDGAVYILQGGLPAWRHSGLETKPGSSIIVPRSSDPDLWWQEAFLASYNMSEVMDEIRLDPSIAAQIVDARPPSRFSGAACEPRPGLRGGHIPGSINIPYNSIIKDGRFSGDFDLKDLDLSRPIVTTCGSGITAAGLALALEARGAEQVMVYDGAWAEWGDPRSMTPVVTGQ